MKKNIPKETEEIGIKAVAEALRSGGTLLSAACPICSYPLIKIKDKVYCKVCNNEVIIYKDENELPKEYQQILKRNALGVDRQQSPMAKTLTTKIEGLRKKLDDADDPDEIIKISKAIDKLLYTLRSLEEG